MPFPPQLRPHGAQVQFHLEVGYRQGQSSPVLASPVLWVHMADTKSHTRSADAVNEAQIQDLHKLPLLGMQRRSSICTGCHDKMAKAGYPPKEGVCT